MIFWFFSRLLTSTLVSTSRLLSPIAALHKTLKHTMYCCTYPEQGVFSGLFFFCDTSHIPEQTRQNASTLNWTFPFLSTFFHSLDSFRPNSTKMPKKMTNLPKYGPSGPVLPKFGAFCHFWAFLGKISTLRQKNCFIEAFAVQCCPI